MLINKLLIKKLNVFQQHSTWTYNKNKLYETWLLIQRYTQFWFFRKWPGTCFSTTFCVRVFKKNAFDCLTVFLLEIMSIMCLSIIFFPACDVINFEMNHSFVKKPFSYFTKKVKTKIWTTSEQKELCKKRCL